MLDIESIRKRAEVAHNSIKNEFACDGYYSDDNGKSKIFNFYNELLEALDELERTRAAAVELREALDNYASEAGCYCDRVDVDDTHTEPCASVIKALENTKWLEKDQ